MKISILIFHSNIYNYINKKYVDICLKSLYQQTFSDYSVFELCYDFSNLKIWNDSSKDYHFFNESFNNKNDALNFLLKKAFYDFNTDFVFIVNLDDIYHKSRIEKLIKFSNNYDIISSNYFLLFDNNMKKRTLVQDKYEDDYDIDNMIKFMIKNNKRVVDISGVLFNKNVIEKCGFFDNDFGYFSHFILWKKSIKTNLNIFISPEFLLYYRQNSNKNNKNKIKL